MTRTTAESERLAARPNGRRLLYLVPLALFVLIGALLAIGLTRDPSVLPSVLIDKPVPTFALPPLEGRDTDGLSSDDLAGGGVKLVNVFASWCGPCRAEHPLLQRLTDSGVTVHGINYKDRPEDVSGWLAQLGDPFARIGADRDGRVAIEWGVYGVPETFVVDDAGRIRHRHVGPLRPSDVEQKILPMLEDLGG